MAKTTQEQLILNHLQKGFSITPIQALNLFGCFRLASRISNLRKKYIIMDDWVKTASGKRVKKYFMYVSELRRDNGGKLHLKKNG